MFVSLRKSVIIIARGGSKGLPRKNVLLHNGKPLIAHAIDAGLRSSVGRVWVSTDDDEIAAVAVKAGANLLRQPPEVSTDTSSDLDAFTYVLSQPVIASLELDYVVHLRATFPDVTPQLIDSAAEQFEAARDRYDSLRSVVRSNQHPCKMWFVANDELTPVIPGNALHSSQRQILPTVYWQNAAIDLFKVSNVLEKRSMVGGNIMPFIMDAEQGVDVDTWDDYQRLIARV